MDKPETQAVLGQETEWTNQRHRQYSDKTSNGQTRDTGIIDKRDRMDKPETQPVLRQDTEWTNQKTGSFEPRYRIDIPETHVVLRQDTEWANQRNMQYCDKTQKGDKQSKNHNTENWRDEQHKPHQHPTPPK